MVGPAFQFMRDAASHFQAEPGNGANHQRVDADAILQGVQTLRYTFVDEADGADLYPDKGIAALGSDFMSVVDEL